MSQVVQARCPHCQNVLRIPPEWLTKPMRCKFCRNTFQAKSRSSSSASTNVQTAAPTPATKANAPIPIAEPSTAYQTAPPVAPRPSTPPAPPRSSSGDPFGFDEDDVPVETSSNQPKKKRKKGSGALLLVFMFLFLFVLGASGAGLVIYKVVITPNGGGKSLPTPFVKNGDARTDRATDDGPVKNADQADNDKSNTDKTNPAPPPPTDKGAKKERTPTKDFLKKGPKTNPPPRKDDKKDKAKKGPIFSNGPFPRRALLISVNNYLMFNTVHYGSPADSFKNGYPGSSTAVLRDRLTRPPMYFPATQVFELSDGVPMNAKTAKPHSTQKSVLQSTIHDFADTSRAQDRVLIVFAGHATSVEGKPYLVPIDGNMKKPDSLLPLEWVFDELKKCKAQQKVLVLDVFRYSPSRGFELPSTGEGAEGAMPEDFDKALMNPPAGVQVLVSCQKEQSSIELDGGSAFMQAFCNSLQGGPEMAGIANPTEPIPIDNLVVKINQRLKDLVTAEKRTQIARLTGTPGTSIGYEAGEALAQTISLKEPTVAGGDAAKPAAVNNILVELSIIPQVRETRAGDINLLRAQNLPAFPSKTIDSYKPDGYQNLMDLEKKYQKDSEAFAKEFPLRAAYFDALEALKESQKLQMRETLNSPVDPKRKAAFLNEQEPIGISIFKLNSALAVIKRAEKQREMETSKRWQANFDYMKARLQSRVMYLYEYNYTLGQIRADNLPELAAGQSGWRVGISGAKLNVTENEAKDLAKKTKKLWNEIEERYPDTPWALLAQRESMIALGLTWRAKSD
ncbi:MAG TPA: caspase family protein [Gemmataceae bacterium]|nr:caspase family protein [Gemmataceae bacterium]